MTIEALQKGYLRMVRALYDPINYSDRCLGEISRLPRPREKPATTVARSSLAGSSGCCSGICSTRIARS